MVETVNDLLKKPIRVQKKQGFYSFESFVQGVRGLLSRIDENGNVFFSDVDLVMDKLLNGAIQAEEEGFTGALHTFLSIRESMYFLIEKGMFRYIDPMLCQTLSNTTPSNSFCLNSKIKYPNLLMLLPSRMHLKVVLLRRVEEGLCYTLFHQKKDVMSAGYFGILPFNEPIDTHLGDISILGEEMKSIHFFFNNFLMWQQSMHDKGQEVIELDAPTRKMGFGKNSKQLIVPRVIGEGYKPKVIRNYESTGSHASPTTHWRSGHWRQQPFGKKEDQKYKTIWIEPVLVNA